MPIPIPYWQEELNRDRGYYKFQANEIDQAKSNIIGSLNNYCGFDGFISSYLSSSLKKRISTIINDIGDAQPRTIDFELASIQNEISVEISKLLISPNKKEQLLRELSFVSKCLTLLKITSMAKTLLKMEIMEIDHYIETGGKDKAKMFRAYNKVLQEKYEEHEIWKSKQYNLAFSYFKTVNSYNRETNEEKGIIEECFSSALESLKQYFDRNQYHYRQPVTTKSGCMSVMIIGVVLLSWLML